MGGPGSEREVSLASGKAVLKALPEASETSRSEPGPPINTAIFLWDNMVRNAPRPRR